MGFAHDRARVSGTLGLTVQARQDAIVKNLLKSGSFGQMILGVDHDLSENVWRLGEEKCEYVRVTMERYREAVRE